MNFIEIMNQIAVLFIMLFIGFFLNKRDIIDDHTSKKLSSLVVNFTAPFLIINAMLQQNNLKSQEILLMLSISGGLYGISIIMALIVPKLLRVKKQDAGIYRFMLVFGNVAFMGFPVIVVFFGEQALVYASILNLPFNILVYTLGIYFVSSFNGEEVKFKWSKVVNAGVVSVIIGLVLFAFGIKLPSFLGDTIKMIGGLTTPLSMIVIGASLAHVKLKSLFTNTRLYIYSIFKLLMLPTLVFFGLSALGINKEILGVAVILSGMPAAANTVMMSKEYGGNVSLAAEGVFISTMLSAITIPLLALLLS